ncbi:hypothetical protein CERZMDRAFT_97719 [Cercospora zeae-maydis SCOH1-5]|uniref:Uncharacterized protein n=1 Tax=Cercospora zeae-maydis SCOH1-5 TaxID=717836 RepID=A0A6A6FGE7_9PEZI|nr:hypothetical protein CERZMDRAFT_97719 [Cercospora zeae-maydis SCOH1-5]
MQPSSILALIAAAAGIAQAGNFLNDPTGACKGKGLKASCEYNVDYEYDGYDGKRHHQVCDGSSYCMSRSGLLNDHSQGGINENMCQQCVDCCTDTIIS